MAGDENPISVGDGLLQVEVGERHPIAGCADGVALELERGAIAGGGGRRVDSKSFGQRTRPFGGGNHFAPKERHKAKGRLPFRGRAILFSQHSFSLCAAGRRWKACRPKW